MSNRNSDQNFFDSLQVDASERAKEIDGKGNYDDFDAFNEWQQEYPYHQDVLSTSTKWRTAKSLKMLQDQLNKNFPDRSKKSDGTIGDKNHCPNDDGSGSSDHCLNITDGDFRIVTAYDATHDPDNGCDMNVVVESIRSDRDSRIKYIIWNKRICSSKKIGGADPWQWRDYTRSNPHTKHAHFSVLPEKENYDDESSWNIGQQSLTS